MVDHFVTARELVAKPDIGVMADPAALADTELWQDIAENSDAIAEIARQQAVVLGCHTGAASAEVRAQLAKAHGRTWDRLNCELEAYRAELRQRGYAA